MRAPLSPVGGGRKLHTFGEPEGFDSPVSKSLRDNGKPYHASWPSVTSTLMMRARGEGLERLMIIGLTPGVLPFLLPQAGRFGPFV